MTRKSMPESEVPPGDARQVRSRGALAAAMLALLEEVPFDQITIRSLSARAGTGYATFFRHYSTKEALLGAVASAEIGGLLAMAVPLLGDGGSLESTRAMCAHVAAHRALWSALLTGGAAGIVRDEFISQARTLAQGMPVPDSWLPSDLSVVHGTSATITLLAWWLEHGDGISAEAIAEILNRLVIAPLIGSVGGSGALPLVPRP